MAKLLSSSLKFSGATKGKLIDLLNQQLATIVDLQSQAKQAHWNVRGPHFHHYHKLFEELSGMLDAHIDTIAERVSAFGGLARGTVREAAALTQLKELSPSITKDRDLIKALRDRYAVAAELVRKAIDVADSLEDDDTEDMLVGLSRDLDKSVWFLDASAS